MKRMLAVVLVLGIASMAMASDLVWTLTYKDTRNANNTGVDGTAVVVSGTTITKGPTWAAGDRLEFNIALLYTPANFIDSKTGTPCLVSDGMNLQIAGLNVNMTGGLTPGITNKGSGINIQYQPESSSPAAVNDPGIAFGFGSLPVTLGDGGAVSTDMQDMLVTVGDTADLNAAGMAADMQVFQAGSTASNAAGVLRIAWDGTTASTLNIDSVPNAANLSVYAHNALGNTDFTTFLGQYICTSTPSATFSFSAVPEPVTMVLLGVGALFLRRR